MILPTRRVGKKLAGGGNHRYVIEGNPAPDGAAESLMSSTHLGLHYHLIFGTKNHEPLIAPAWRSRLHAYMGGILSSLDTVPEIVGGMEDHVLILAGLRATHRLADVMREIKSASSRWVHEEMSLPAFA